MAKITRKIQKIFAIDSGFQEVSQFGSLANSTPSFTTDPDVIQALTQFTDGWFKAVIGNNSPAIQDVNALDYVETYNIAYAQQAGIPEWYAGTTYYIGSLATDGFGNVYVSATNDNLNNPISDTVNWSSAGRLTRNVCGAAVTVVTGTTYWYPNYNISTGVTWTVDTGGSLMSAGTTIVNGTLIVNGTSITL